MVCIQTTSDDKECIILRIYECRKCHFDGVTETRETLCGSSNTKTNLAKSMAMKLKTAMHRITKEMRTMKHDNLTDLEKQALQFAAGWIERKNL